MYLAAEIIDGIVSPIGSVEKTRAGAVITMENAAKKGPSGRKYRVFQLVLVKAFEVPKRKNETPVSDVIAQKSVAATQKSEPTPSFLKSPKR